MKYLHLTLILFVALIVASCVSTKKIPYMVEAEAIPQETLNQVAKVTEPVIMPGDLLEILVTASNPDVVKPFNRMGMVYELAGTLSSYGNNTTNSSAYYLVDNEGNIEFPVIGTLKIGGMNKAEAQKVILDAISPKYITEKDCISCYSAVIFSQNGVFIYIFAYFLQYEYYIKHLMSINMQQF